MEMERVRLFDGFFSRPPPVVNFGLEIFSSDDGQTHSFGDGI